ncbi:hypothetical protein ACKJPP_05945 [Neisseria polysaccharea]|uniref:hypothetical protein n=1 Tax=Neisseria polysaccharea TaxID=489 RepID=UPI0019011F5D
MKQMLLAVGVAAVLAGCGKDAGGYEGYWREKSDKKGVLSDRSACACGIAKLRLNAPDWP